MQDPTSGLVIGAAICAGLTVWLTVPPRIDPAPVPARAVPGASRRPQWAPVAAAFGTWAFVGGVQGVVIAAVVGGVVAVIVARAEDPHARRHRVAVERQLPHVVLILGSALKAGAPVGRALEVVGEAFPGPAADQLADVTARLHLGVDPAVAWEHLRADPSLAPLARVMASSARSGAPVAEAVTRLAEDLAEQSRARDEMRARTVGVRAAVPLGLCLLPAFLVLGIVPVVAGLLTTLLE